MLIADINILDFMSENPLKIFYRKILRRIIIIFEELNNTNPSIASGTAQTSFYTKSVTGFFDLLTGIGNNLISYRDSSFVSGSAGYVKTGVAITEDTSINVKVIYSTQFDENPLVAKLTLSGINNNIIERYITGVK